MSIAPFTDDEVAAIIAAAAEPNTDVGLSRLVEAFPDRYGLHRAAVLADRIRLGQPVNLGDGTTVETVTELGTVVGTRDRAAG